MIISSKKRRAIDKVKQFCTLIPRFSDMRFGNSITSSSGNVVKASSKPLAASTETSAQNTNIAAIATPQHTDGHVTRLISPAATIPRIRKTTNAYSEVLNKLQAAITFEARLEELKDLNTQLRIRNLDTKKMLDAGGRGVLFNWISDINFDDRQLPYMGMYLDYLINLLDNVSEVLDFIF